MGQGGWAAPVGGRGLVFRVFVQMPGGRKQARKAGFLTNHNSYNPSPCSQVAICIRHAAIVVCLLLLPLLLSSAARIPCRCSRGAAAAAGRAFWPLLRLALGCGPLGKEPHQHLLSKVDLEVDRRLSISKVLQVSFGRAAVVRQSSSTMHGCRAGRPHRTGSPQQAPCSTLEAPVFNN